MTVFDAYQKNIGSLTGPVATDMNQLITNAVNMKPDASTVKSLLFPKVDTLIALFPSEKKDDPDLNRELDKICQTDNIPNEISPAKSKYVLKTYTTPFKLAMINLYACVMTKTGWGTLTGSGDTQIIVPAMSNLETLRDDICKRKLIKDGSMPDEYTGWTRLDLQTEKLTDNAVDLRKVDV